MLRTGVIATQVAGSSQAFGGWLSVGFWLALLAALASTALFLINRRRDGVSYRLASISAGHPDMLVTIDASGRIGWINAATATRLGRSAREASGRMAEDVLPGALLAALRKPEGWSSSTHEHRLTGADGRSFWVEARATPLPGGEALISMHEITALKERETALTKARDESAARALHDPLTGLPNRAALAPRLAHEITSAQRRGRRVGVLHLDLKDFRSYATGFGTAAADAALIAAAGRLRETLEPGGYLGRFEGDRFVAVLSGPESEAPVERQAQRLISALDGPLNAPGRPVFGVAAGLAILPENAPADADPAALIAEAGIALSDRKRHREAGLTRFTSELRQRADRAARLALELERARMANQFVPWFRPRVAPKDGRPTGFAVELRWRHPKRGLLVGTQLIEDGAPPALVASAGAHVLEQAVEQFAIWRDQQLFAGALTLSLPGAGPAAMEFLDRLKLAVDRHEITPANIVVAFPGPEIPAKPFADAGFQIERSATGADTATLGNLLGGPTNVLRLPLADEKSGKAKPLEALIALAEATGTGLLATHVDSSDALDVAAKLRIGQAEGDAAGAAMPGDEVPELLKKASAVRRKSERRKRA